MMSRLSRHVHVGGIACALCVSALLFLGASPVVFANRRGRRHRHLLAGFGSLARQGGTAPRNCWSGPEACALLAMLWFILFLSERDARLFLCIPDHTPRPNRSGCGPGSAMPLAAEWPSAFSTAARGSTYCAAGRTCKGLAVPQRLWAGSRFLLQATTWSSPALC